MHILEHTALPSPENGASCGWHSCPWRAFACASVNCSVCAPTSAPQAQGNEFPGNWSVPTSFYKLPDGDHDVVKRQLRAGKQLPSGFTPCLSMSTWGAGSSKPLPPGLKDRPEGGQHLHQYMLTCLYISVFTPRGSPFLTYVGVKKQLRFADPFASNPLEPPAGYPVFAFALPRIPGSNS